MQPVIYELSPVDGEATGKVQRFCSDACRDKFFQDAIGKDPNYPCLVVFGNDDEGCEDEVCSECNGALDGTIAINKQTFLNILGALLSAQTDYLHDKEGKLSLTISDLDQRIEQVNAALAPLLSNPQTTAPGT